MISTYYGNRVSEEELNARNKSISTASFKAYKNMPLFLNFGFAFGAFEKNTIFIAKE